MDNTKEKLTQKRLVYAVPQTPGGQEASKFSQLETLEEPKKVGGESNIDAMVTEADGILGMQDEEFCNRFGSEYVFGGANLEYINPPKPGDADFAAKQLDYVTRLALIRECKVDKVVSLDAEITRLADSTFQGKLETLRKKSNVKVDKVLDEATKFFSTAINVGMFKNKAEQESFQKTLESFGIDNKELVEKGEVSDKMDAANDQYENDKDALETAKLKIKELDDEMTDIKENFDRHSSARAKLLKSIGYVALAALGISTAGYGIGLWAASPWLTANAFFWTGKVSLLASTIFSTGWTAVGTGALTAGIISYPEAVKGGHSLFNLSKRVPTNLPSWLTSIPLVGELLPEKVGELSKAEKAESLSKQQKAKIDRQMARLVKREEIKKRPITNKLNRLATLKSDNDQEMSVVRQELQLLNAVPVPVPAEITTKKTAAKNKMKELLKKKQLIDQGTEHLQKSLKVFELADQQRKRLTKYSGGAGTPTLDADTLDLIMQSEYLPGTKGELASYYGEQVTGAKKAQETIGEINPQEVYQHVAQLTVSERDLLYKTHPAPAPATGWLEGLPGGLGTPEARAALLTPVESLKRSHKPIYDLCAQIVNLRQENPFRKTAEKTLKEALSEAKTKIDGLKSAMRTKVSAFAANYKPEYIDLTGFAKKGLSHLAEKVLGGENSLVQVLNQDGINGAELVKTIDADPAAKVKHDDLTEQQWTDLDKILQEIDCSGGIPNYLINADGKVEQSQEAKDRLLTAVRTAFDVLPATMRTALNQKPNQIQMLTEIIDPAYSATPIPSPAGYAPNFIAYLEACEPIHLERIHQTLQFAKNNMRVQPNGRDIESIAAHEERLTIAAWDAINFGDSTLLTIDVVLLKNPEKAFDEARKALGIRKAFVKKSALGSATKASFQDLLTHYLTQPGADTDDLELMREILEGIGQKKIVSVPLKEFKTATTATSTGPEDYKLMSVEGLVRDLKADIRATFASFPAGTKMSDITAIDYAAGGAPGGLPVPDLKPALAGLDYDSRTGELKFNGQPLDHETNRDTLPYLAHDVSLLKKAIGGGEFVYRAGPPIKLIRGPGAVSGNYYNLATKLKV